MWWNKNVTINKMGKHICGILGCYSTTSSNITVHRLVISYQKYIRYKYSFCKAKYAVIIFKIIQLWFHKQTDISTVRLKYIYQERDSINLPTGCSKILIRSDNVFDEIHLVTLWYQNNHVKYWVMILEHPVVSSKWSYIC